MRSVLLALCMVVVLAGVAGPAGAAVTEYETHSSTLLTSTSVEDKFIRELEGWAPGGPYGGEMGISRTITAGWSVSCTCGWDFKSVVAASVGISINYSTSNTVERSWVIPPNLWGRIVQLAG